MSEENVCVIPENLATHEERLAAKPAIMAAIGAHFMRIETGKSVVCELEASAAEDIRKVVKIYGNGPHKMPLVGRPNMIVTFRKDGDTYRMSARNMDEIT